MSARVQGRTVSVDGRPIRSADDPARCDACATTAYGERIQCFERHDHGGSHYAEDTEGRSFLWTLPSDRKGGDE